MLLDALIIGLNGPLNGIKFHYNRFLKKGMYPTFLVYQFTQRCNSRCIMCNIWRESPTNELDVKQIASIVTSPLFHQIEGINLTGGEVFLREDFEEAVNILCGLPRLKTIGVSTNGFATNLIIKRIKAVNPVLTSHNINLTVKVSIDGIESTHNEIRGIENGFRRSISTLKEIRNLGYRQINSGISCLIIDKNVNELSSMRKELLLSTDNISYTIPSISDGYFHNEDNNGQLLNPTNYPPIISFLKRTVQQSPEHGFYNTKLIDFMKNQKRTFSCLGGYRTIYMDNHGNIFPCAILSRKESPYYFGNIMDADIENNYLYKKGETVRQLISVSKVCKTCIFACDLRNHLREEFFEYFMFYVRHPYYAYLLAKKMKKKSIRKDYLA